MMAPARQGFVGGAQAEVLSPALPPGDDCNLAAVAQGHVGHGASIAQAASQYGRRRRACSRTLAGSGCRGKA